VALVTIVVLVISVIQKRRLARECTRPG
jgi:hypothetical protein